MAFDSLDESRYGSFSAEYTPRGCNIRVVQRAIAFSPFAANSPPKIRPPVRRCQPACAQYFTMNARYRQDVTTEAHQRYRYGGRCGASHPECFMLAEERVWEEEEDPRQRVWGEFICSEQSTLQLPLSAGDKMPALSGRQIEVVRCGGIEIMSRAREEARSLRL